MMTRLKYFFQPYNQLGEPITKLIKPFFNLVERHNQFGEPFSKLIKPFFKVCGRLENFPRSLEKTREWLKNSHRSLGKTRERLKNSPRSLGKTRERLDILVLRAKQTAVPFWNPDPGQINLDDCAKVYPDTLNWFQGLITCQSCSVPEMMAAAPEQGQSEMKPDPAAIQPGDKREYSKNWAPDIFIPITWANRPLNHWIKYFGKLSSGHSIEWRAGWQRVIFSYEWYEKLPDKPDFRGLQPQPNPVLHGLFQQYFGPFLRPGIWEAGIGADKINDGLH